MCVAPSNTFESVSADIFVVYPTLLSVVQARGALSSDLWHGFYALSDETLVLGPLHFLWYPTSRQ
eukprot:6180908-Amphidinium_carterae.1